MAGARSLSEDPIGQVVAKLNDVSEPKIDHLAASFRFRLRPSTNRSRSAPSLRSSGPAMNELGRLRPARQSWRASWPTPLECSPETEAKINEISFCWPASAWLIFHLGRKQICIRLGRPSAKDNRAALTYRRPLRLSWPGAWAWPANDAGLAALGLFNLRPGESSTSDGRPKREPIMGRQ